MEKQLIDRLAVEIYPSRLEMGRAAAADIAGAIRAVLTEKAECNMIFAAAPSQSDMLAVLAQNPDVDFTRVNAFHMDEYCGLDPEAPQGFGNFLRDAIFSKASFRSVSYLLGGAEDTAGECARYSALLAQYPTDIVCMGIGENGHIAFNDPGVADFNDPVWVKRVELDQKCRQQQVNDGCFASLDQVPRYALTLTVPALFRGAQLFCVVPAATKAQAVRDTLRDEISTRCPASVLRRHPHAKLYLDQDSAALL